MTGSLGASGGLRVGGPLHPRHPVTLRDAAASSRSRCASREAPPPGRSRSAHGPLAALLRRGPPRWSFSAASSLWVTGLYTTDLDRMDGYGLLTAVGPGWFIALGLLWWASPSRSGRGPASPGSSAHIRGVVIMRPRLDRVPLRRPALRLDLQAPRRGRGDHRQRRPRRPVARRLQQLAGLLRRGRLAERGDRCRPDPLRRLGAGLLHGHRRRRPAARPSRAWPSATASAGPRSGSTSSPTGSGRTTSPPRRWPSRCRCSCSASVCAARRPAPTPASRRFDRWLRRRHSATLRWLARRAPQHRRLHGAVTAAGPLGGGRRRPGLHGRRRHPPAVAAAGRRPGHRHRADRRPGAVVGPRGDAAVETWWVGQAWPFVGEQLRPLRRQPGPAGAARPTREHGHGRGRVVYWARASAVGVCVVAASAPSASSGGPRACPAGDAGASSIPCRSRSPHALAGRGFSPTAARASYRASPVRAAPGSRSWRGDVRAPRGPVAAPGAECFRLVGVTAVVERPDAPRLLRAPSCATT